jgi:putative CocE/NonD family hydrolase
MTMKVEYGYEPTDEITVVPGVSMTMRDGTVLKGLMYRPKADGRYPVLVERVPYELTQRCKPYAEYYSSRGYVFVGQSTRGVFGSGGNESFSENYDGWGMNRDGYDTIEWIAAQPWCNGRIGMLDGSASGTTQYMVAPTRPPHLTALFVRMGSSDPYAFYRGGAFLLGMFLAWCAGQMVARLSHPTAPPGSEPRLLRFKKALEEIEGLYRYLPVKSNPIFTEAWDLASQLLEHPTDGPYWWQKNLAFQYREVDVPILHLSGWYDLLLDSTIRSFQGIRTHGRSERCRGNQRLVIGPWVHAPTAPYERTSGELDFGPDAAIDLNAFRLQWYDHWLKGAQNGAMDSAPVRIFLMGDNRWLDFESWPPPARRLTPLYLREGAGRSNDSLNNGGLSFEMPQEAERPDSYVYDPESPVRSVVSGLHGGARDHRSVEGGMLTYTTDVLQKDLTVIGPVKAVLHSLTSAPDTDWVVRLCDVWPDGRSMNVCDGILRARYRDSFERPELVRPEQVYRFEVDMWATAQVFKAGHKIRVHVTSSDFPRYDRNLNTGGALGEEARGQAAVNTVFHDAIRPSHILLPMMERV